MVGKSKQQKKEKEKKDMLSDKERVDQGEMLARIVIEVLGAPKEYVEEAVQLVVDRIHRTKDLEVVSESTFEAEERGKLFSTFSEVEIWFKNIDALIKFLFDFTPSSVEIMLPAKVPLAGSVLSGFCNDFLLKMHDLGLKLKDTAANVQFLQKNTDTLVRNFLNFALKEPRSAPEISKIAGIPEKNVEALLGNFEKAGIVEKKDGMYVLSKKKKGKNQ